MKNQLVIKIAALSIVVGAFALFIPAPVYAHISVVPAEVQPGNYQVFTTSVPNEKEISVSGIRLVIPDNVESVTPTAKQGWKIAVKKEGKRITEISWTGGSIDAGLRDEFTFSAKVPASEGEIVWKAYQAYQDGTVVAWDQRPIEDHGHSDEKQSGPYSITEVAEEPEPSVESKNQTNVIAYALSGFALVVAIIAFGRAIKK